MEFASLYLLSSLVASNTALYLIFFAYFFIPFAATTGGKMQRLKGAKHYRRLFMLQVVITVWYAYAPQGAYAIAAKYAWYISLVPTLLVASYYGMTPNGFKAWFYWNVKAKWLPKHANFNVYIFKDVKDPLEGLEETREYLVTNDQEALPNLAKALYSEKLKPNESSPYANAEGYYVTKKAGNQRFTFARTAIEAMFDLNDDRDVVKQLMRAVQKYELFVLENPFKQSNTSGPNKKVAFYVSDDNALRCLVIARSCFKHRDELNEREQKHIFGHVIKPVQKDHEASSEKSA